VRCSFRAILLQTYLLLFKLIFKNNLYSVTRHSKLKHRKETKKDQSVLKISETFMKNVFFQVFTSVGKMSTAYETCNSILLAHGELNK
jgi:hypothetical protein